MPFDCVADEKNFPKLDEASMRSTVERLKKGFPDGLQLSFDGEAVHIGKWVASRHINFKNLNKFVAAVMRENGVLLSSHPKWKMQEAAAVFGRKPSAFYTHFNKLQYKVFVAPHVHILTKVAYSPGRINWKALAIVEQHKDILQEVYDDGLYNILPIVAVTGKTPKELKKELGATWKAICKNSNNKNVALANYAIKRATPLPNVIDVIRACHSLPTTVLNTYRGLRGEVLMHVAAHYKGKWGKFDSAVVHIVEDTKRLAEQLSQPFDPLWTPRRMKEEHDRMGQEIAKRRNSPAKLPILADVPVKWLVHGEFTATLLDSRKLIGEEGVEMRHCVASYADYVAEGTYLVYSVTRSGVRSSTIGINVTPVKVVMNTVGKQEPTTLETRNVYKFSQHYGRFNAAVTNEQEKELCKMIIEQLNNFNKGETK